MPAPFPLTPAPVPLCPGKSLTRYSHYSHSHLLLFRLKGFHSFHAFITRSDSLPFDAHSTRRPVVICLKGSKTYQRGLRNCTSWQVKVLIMLWWYFSPTAIVPYEALHASSTFTHMDTLHWCCLSYAPSIATSSLDKNGHIRGDTPSSAGGSGGGCFSVVVSNYDKDLPS